ncbi:hypothetical protein ACE1AT_12645 [Pelatocladus sp. BLCC-F211]|uniref:hypothetical protein n=1 Tax=Pelatocladus sp. BLCC-F211 TaxID=3342752 RepID=UPI0035B948EC
MLSQKSKEVWKDAIAFVHYEGETRLQHLSIDVKKHHPPEYYLGQSFTEEDKTYTATKIITLLPEDNPLLFEQIAKEAEGIIPKEIWKICFESKSIL